MVDQINSWIDAKQYEKVESLKLQLDETVRSVSIQLLNAGVPKPTILFYGVALAITGGAVRGKDWHHDYDHWFIADRTTLGVAWRQDASYFICVIDHVRRDIAYDNFAKTVSRGDEVIRGLQ